MTVLARKAQCFNQYLMIFHVIICALSKKDITLQRFFKAQREFIPCDGELSNIH